MSEELLALTTVEDEAAARRLARSLVEAQVAACVNILPGAVSLFPWKGAVDEEGECLLLIKTSRTAWAALERRLQESHPYELPELIAVSIEAGSAAYLDWLNANLRP